MYVRLAGPVCNLFVVVIYVPHKGRKEVPFAKDTLKQVQELLVTVCKMDCIILMGDMNCELQRNVQGYTGKWCMTTRKDNEHGDQMITLMRNYDLFAVNTMFKPTRKVWGEKKKINTATRT